MNGEYHELGSNRQLNKLNTFEYYIPCIKMGSVPQSIQNEVVRVSLSSLYLLGVSMDVFVDPPPPANLIDLKTINENNLPTLPRFNGDNMIIPVIMLSSMPIYEPDGQTESIGIYSPENAVCYINLHRRLDQFDLKNIGEADDIVLDASVLSSEEKQAGLIVIEEIIHFVQDKYWHRPWTNGTSASMDIKEHDEDPLEKEAKKLKKFLIKQIYPELLLN